MSDSEYDPNSESSSSETDSETGSEPDSEPDSESGSESDSEPVSEMLDGKMAFDPEPESDDDLPISKLTRKGKQERIIGDLREYIRCMEMQIKAIRKVCDPIRNQIVRHKYTSRRKRQRELEKELAAKHKQLRTAKRMLDA